VEAEYLLAISFAGAEHLLIITRHCPFRYASALRWHIEMDNVGY